LLSQPQASESPGRLVLWPNSAGRLFSRRPDESFSVAQNLLVHKELQQLAWVNRGGLLVGQSREKYRPGGGRLEAFLPGAA
jgi:hypothetical protein